MYHLKVNIYILIAEEGRRPKRFIKFYWQLLVACLGFNSILYIYIIYPYQKIHT